jgi:hypothetical protein
MIHSYLLSKLLSSAGAPAPSASHIKETPNVPAFNVKEVHLLNYPDE